MKITDELLEKYFKGKCDPEEKREIGAFLIQIDEFPDHLMMKHEWDSVDEAILSDEKSNQLFDNIKSKAFARFRVKRWFINIAAAISVIFGIWYFNQANHNQESKFVSKEKKTNQNEKIIGWKSTVNYSNNWEKVLLPDGSEVKVYQGAEIRYSHPFIKKKREIYLIGKGYFKVKKDKNCPFVVYANGVSTTALGTSFTVTAARNSTIVKVELHTGKIWVKNVSSDIQTPLFSRILNPGDILSIDKSSKKLRVSTLSSEVPKEKTMSINFTQAPFKEVFEKLSEHYLVTIDFENEVVNDKFFTGTLYLHKPVDSLLAEITELNKLKLIKTGKKYLIKK